MGGQDIEVRKPPVGAVLRQHPQGVRGTCGWCGLPCEDKTPGRGWLKWYHDACSLEMAIIERPEQARISVFKRDQGICCDCGEDWSLMSVFRPAYPVKPEYAHGDRMSPGPKPGTFCTISQHCFDWHVREKDRVFAPYVELTVISLWHVDHNVPLWKVKHLPDLQRLEYFKLANLITRCHRCHQFKTDEEAAERAKYDRLAEPQLAPASKWAKGRKIQNRGFSKGHRPMRGR